MNGSDEHVRLLTEARSGNRDSMTRLAVLARQRLYPFVFRKTRDHEQTQDMLQETMLAMILWLHSLRNVSTFWPWIHRVAESKVQEHFRSRHRELTTTLRALEDHEDTAEQPATDHDVLGLLIRKESVERLSAAVGQLDRYDRDVVCLRCFEQLSYFDIASLTGHSPQYVRMRFHRAKQRLRRKLSCETPDGGTHV
jgi:RNA polymerase sigma factor (sigma-70 family)